MVIKIEKVFGFFIVMFIILNNINFLNCNINIILNLFEIFKKSTTFVNIFFIVVKNFSMNVIAVTITIILIINFFINLIKNILVTLLLSFLIILLLKLLL